MTLVPTEEGILGIISKLHDQSPEAAATLVRLGLFESLQDQLEPLRPEMTEHVYKQMEQVNQRARAALLRNHVAKAAAGEDEPDDAEFAAALALLDEHVEKGLVGWALNFFNRQHPRDEQGRFTSAQQQGPQHADHGHMRGDAVDLTRAVLNTNSPTASRLTRGLFADADNVKDQSSHAAQWYGQTQGTERQAYNRLRLTGDALQTMGEPGSTAHTVGTAANLIGNLGPEAEKVIGPGIRRTAYRYRGTERRPDTAVTLPMKQANEIIYDLASGDPAKRGRALQKIERERTARGGNDPVAQITSREINPRIPVDKQNLMIRGNTAVASMLGIGSTREEGKNLLPDLELTQISIESGEMPPSQGVIIDSRGNIVSQAVGYNGDHYLPFDLRNLGALYGGQYVRTRATGGPTSEDIYTGLLTGTRQIQVVSNSGVFTVEFDPDLRGGRRYNDKVKRMIERYESMLGAIGSGALYETDVSPERMRQLRRDAVKGARTDKEFRDNLEVLVQRERLQARASEDDENTSRQRAEDWADGALRSEERKAADAGRPYSAQRRAQRRDELIRQAIREGGEDTIRRLRLDGEGYGRALKALQQEFPYYIRTASFEPLPKWLESHGLSSDERFAAHAPADLGYVEPGQTNFKRGYENADGTPRRGFRSARKVPTTAPARTAVAGGAAPAAAAAGAAEQPAEGGQQAQTRLTGPAAQANGAPAAAQTMEQLAAPGGKLFEAAKGHVRNFLEAIRQLHDPTLGLPAETDNDVDADFAHNTVKRFFAQSGDSDDRARRAFTEWYLKASPSERHRFVQGVTGPGGLFDWIPDFKMFRDREGEIHDAFDEFNSIANIVQPYAEADSDNPAMTMPDKADPKPIEIPGAPTVLDTDDEFEHFLGQARVNSPEIAQAIETFADLGDDDRMAAVTMAVRSGDQDQALAAQTAWSFNYTREKAEELRELLGDDAAPLEVVSARAPRRRLIFA